MEVYMQPRERPLPAVVRLGIAVLVIAFIAFIGYIGVAYYTGVFPNPDWTGFGTPERNADGQEIAHFKTLWDWLGLLLIPLVLAIGGFFLNRTERINAEKAAEQRAKIERQIAEERAQDTVLETYIDR